MTRAPAPRPRHVLEYLVLRLFAAVIRTLPYRAALAFAWCHARLAYGLMPARVQEARRRIRSVFGDRLDARAVNAAAWESWRTIVFSGVDMIRMDRLTRKRADALFVPPYRDVVARLRAHAATGRGAILAVPHMGAWELAGAVCRLNGLPIFTLAAPQRNPLVNAYLERLRSAPGIDVVLRGSGALRTVIRRLRGGGFLAILPDVRMRTPALRVPFLGGAANLGAGMALFARHADVPIFPCILTRVGWTRHKVVMAEPIRPDKTLDKQTDLRRMTLATLAVVENAIRREPGQWFWFNKRWVLDPVDARPPNPGTEQTGQEA
ncbi:MAG: lysophospholipid acyltransferase family protein [Lentisphaerae bacterium]|nr:lysophospholipid acyltransferase family protein [Lentisphaerota bacterium]